MSVIRKTYDQGPLHDVVDEYFEIDGKIEGERKIYYNTGALLSTANYVNNNIVGDHIQYYPNGKIELITKYIDGKTVHMTRYDENGVVISSGSIVYN